MKLKRLQVIFILIFCSLAEGCAKESRIILSETEQETIVSEKEETESGEEKDREGTIYVQVCGAVNQPGVVALPAGSRVFEAIAMSGGLTEDAAADSVNQAQVLTDGQQIMVWTGEEMENRPGLLEASSEAAGEAAQSPEKINLNTATAGELMTLSGIGESRAADIIAYREEHGGFETVEDIMKISGIKEAVFEKIRDQITV